MSEVPLYFEVRGFCAGNGAGHATSVNSAGVNNPTIPHWTFRHGGSRLPRILWISCIYGCPIPSKRGGAEAWKRARLLLGKGGVWGRCADACARHQLMSEGNLRCRGAADLGLIPPPDGGGGGGEVSTGGVGGVGGRQAYARRETNSHALGRIGPPRDG